MASSSVSFNGPRGGCTGLVYDASLGGCAASPNCGTPIAGGAIAPGPGCQPCTALTDIVSIQSSLVGTTPMAPASAPLYAGMLYNVVSSSKQQFDLCGPYSVDPSPAPKGWDTAVVTFLDGVIQTGQQFGVFFSSGDSSNSVFSVTGLIGGAAKTVAGNQNTFSVSYDGNKSVTLTLAAPFWQVQSKYANLIYNGCKETMSGPPVLTFPTAPLQCTANESDSGSYPPGTYWIGYAQNGSAAPSPCSAAVQITALTPFDSITVTSPDFTGFKVDFYLGDGTTATCGNGSMNLVASGWTPSGGAQSVAFLAATPGGKAISWWNSQTDLVKALVIVAPILSVAALALLIVLLVRRKRMN